MITITHNGTDITDHVNTDISITDERNSTRDTCNFSIDKTPGGFTPELNAEIIVTRDGTRIFGGTILSMETAVLAPPTVTYSIECVDFTRQLDRLLVTQNFTSQTVYQIIEFLRDNFAADFTINNVSVTTSVDKISFNRLKVSECLDKLARLNNYYWYVDYHKDIHFFAKNEETAPFNLTDTSDNYVFSSLRVRSDLSQLRNNVLVEGGEVPISERTTKHAGDGERTEFPTNFKFDEKPTVTVDGVEQTVGTEYLDDGGFDCYWSFREKYVRFETAPPAPSSGSTNVHLSGDPLVPLIAFIPDEGSIGEYGTYEHSITENTLRSQDQTIDRGLAELEAYADELNEASFETTTPGLSTGQVIRINSSLHNTDAEYIIQRVEFSPYPNGTSIDGIWSVTLASTATMTIVDAMRALLRPEKVGEDELEELLSFLQLSDSATGSDTLEAPTTTERPYLLADENGDVLAGYDPFICNFAVLEP